MTEPAHAEALDLWWSVVADYCGTTSARERVLTWFERSGGLESLAASVRTRSRAFLAVWLVKNGRTAPPELGPHPVRVLQRLFDSAQLPPAAQVPWPAEIAWQGEQSADAPKRPAPKIHPSRYAKRNAALALLDRFRRALEHEASSKAAVEMLVRYTRDQLEELQGSAADRPHFAKSLSQMATATRHAGWPDVARDLLQWAIERTLTDEYLLTDLVRCHIASGDLFRARQTLDDARGWNLATDGMYAALLEAYGRQSDLPAARELFERAQSDGVCDEFCVTAILDVYGKAGDLRRAQRLFDEAKQRGMISVALYTVLLDAYGKAGDLVRARRVFDMADAADMTGPATYTALIDAYGKSGDVRSAQHVFDRADAEGKVGSFSVTALLNAYAKAGDLVRARQLFDRARARRLVGDLTYALMIDALGKAGEADQARSVLDLAVADDQVCAASCTALNNVYRNSRRPKPRIDVASHAECRVQ